jgi:lysozyme
MNKLITQINKKIIVFFLIMFCTTLTLGILIYNKVIILNNPSSRTYPVRGVDVSHYQGNIDWQILSNQNIDFAFMKATEGSKYVDKQFDKNWAEVQNTNLLFGAYHFFSFDSSGETQAKNFISTVKLTDGMLPPVVDFEFYGDKEKNLPDKIKTRIELKTLLDKLYEYYRVKPIIYATMKSYTMYIKGEFDDYPLWIRNVYYSPQIGMKNKWTFWQYSDTAILNGYNGKEKYIDMNVFRGSIEELEALSIKDK